MLSGDQGPALTPEDGCGYGTWDMDHGTWDLGHGTWKIRLFSISIVRRLRHILAKFGLIKYWKFGFPNMIALF